jgi:hypothetical protein
MTDGTKNISLRTKLRIFETNIKSLVLYGSETWKQTKKNEQDLQAFINKCLNIRWPERITNTELWRRTNQTPIFQTIKQRKWHWIGHILRRPQNNITKQALDWNPQGKRKRGRPITTWRRTLEAELRSIWLSWGEAKKAAHDRNKWRAIVNALCSHRNEEN